MSQMSPLPTSGPAPAKSAAGSRADSRAEAESSALSFASLLSGGKATKSSASPVTEKVSDVHDTVVGGEAIDTATQVVSKALSAQTESVTLDPEQALFPGQALGLGWDTEHIDAGNSDAVNDSVAKVETDADILALLETLDPEMGPLSGIGVSAATVPLDELGDGAAADRQQLLAEAKSMMARSKQTAVETSVVESRSQLLSLQEGAIEPEGEPIILKSAPVSVVATALPAAIGETLRGLNVPSGQTSAGEVGGTVAGLVQAGGNERALDTLAPRMPHTPAQQPREAQAAVAQTLERVAWMSREGLHQAKLQLDPAHLGRVDILLDLEGGDARLQFSAQQPQVKEALEAVLPRLREALAEQGMNLTDASVSYSGQEASSDNPEQDSDRHVTSNRVEDLVASEHEDVRQSVIPSLSGLDLYA